MEGRQRKKRRDAWRAEEDQMLAKVMVESLSKGVKQSDAIRIAVGFIDRTFQACMTRWKSYLQGTHKHLIKRTPDARTGEEVKIVLTSMQKSEQGNVVDSMHCIMEYIKSTQNLLSENNKLSVQNQTLQSQLDIANKKIVELQQDYDAILRVIEMARKTVIKEDTNYIDDKKVSFKMDRNGNLERV